MSLNIFLVFSWPHLLIVNASPESHGRVEFFEHCRIIGWIKWGSIGQYFQVWLSVWVVWLSDQQLTLTELAEAEWRGLVQHSTLPLASQVRSSWIWVGVHQWGLTNQILLDSLWNHVLWKWWVLKILCSYHCYLKIIPTADKGFLNITLLV